MSDPVRVAQPDASPVQSVAKAMWSFWRRGRPVERSGYVVGVLLFLWGLVNVAVLVIGGGSLEGPLSLRKAATFGLSFGLTVITIVWVASFLRLSDRWRAVLLGAFTLASVAETGLVSMQAWRGVPSHFNLETTFDALVARGLAAGGFVLVAIIATLLVVAFRSDPALPLSLRIAIRFGFVTLFASLITGAVMIATGMVLVFGGHPQAAYATGGSLKPTHAVTMHAILVLPLLAWLLSFAEWPERRRVGVMVLGAIGYAVAAAVVAIENIAGVPAWKAPLAADLLMGLGFCGLLAAGCLALKGAASGTAVRGFEHE